MPHDSATQTLLGDLEAPLASMTGSARSPSRRRAKDGGGHPAHHFHPQTVSRVVTRAIALTLELLPIQVDLAELTSPTSSILTQDVVEAYGALAGDFHPCLPFALLQARRYFARQQRLNPSDSDENAGRKLACEALARKLVARTPMHDQYALLSRRFSVVEPDGDESLPLSALESAVDQHATFFLSSNEAQRCVFALWKGLLVQDLRGDNGGANVEYRLYKVGADEQGFLAHFDPGRIAVPRYQFFFRIVLWVLFLACYTIAIQTPERGFGPEDGILYVQLLGYLLEDVVKIYKIGWWATISFWQIVNFSIYSLSAVAFVYRCLDLSTHDPEKQDRFRLLAFQWLSTAAPLIWAKMLTTFDLFHFFGVLQIVVFRMLKESAVFCVLLAVLAVGFGQALTGLDVADEKRDSTKAVVNSLLQALLGSPNFDYYDDPAGSYPFGLVLYYFWSVATIVILLNVLVALFSSSYESEPTFLSFFAGKTVSSIRAPDSYPYPAPFNLIELVIIPLEWVVSKETYARINRVLMSTLFFLPLCAISLFETRISPLRASDLQDLLTEPDEFQSPEEDPEPYRPSSGEADDDRHPGEREGMQISRVKFADLKKRLPSLERSVEGEILHQVLALKAELVTLRAELAELKSERDKADKLEAKAEEVKEEAEEQKVQDGEGAPLG
ncbi:uncharacterized protein JCM10292_001338 [Rhodotorula paludigena]|uniref:uncharacterized protein n=1 Tax=Rhodotorula paludigena TaxID=86838 RepID=UPI00318212E3